MFAKRPARPLEKERGSASGMQFIPRRDLSLLGCCILSVRNVP